MKESSAGSSTNLSFFVRAKKLGILFLLGGILGGLGDLSHVLTGTDGYQDPPFPFPSGQPFWVPFLFGSATVLLGTTHVWTDSWLGPFPRKKQSIAAGSLAGAVFLGLYVMSGLLPFPAGGYADLILWLSAFALWIATDRTWQSLLLGFSTAFIGTCFEVMLVHSNQFFYYPHVANLFGVPSWLPALYVSASIAVGNFSRAYFSE